MPFYRDSVRVIRPPMLATRGGDAVPDMKAAQALPGALWERVTVRDLLQTERTDVDRDVTRSQWRVASKPGTGDFDIREHDLVRLRSGRLTSVVGIPARPADPMSPTAALHHVEVLLEEVDV